MLAAADECAVWVRRSPDGLVKQSVEEQATGARVTPIEAEGEFVEVVVDLVGPDPALVDRQQPSFEQSSDPMHAWQLLGGVLGRGSDGHRPVHVTDAFDTSVTLPGVGE